MVSSVDRFSHGNGWEKCSERSREARERLHNPEIPGRLPRPDLSPNDPQPPIVRVDDDNRKKVEPLPVPFPIRIAPDEGCYGRGRRVKVPPVPEPIGPALEMLA